MHEISILLCALYNNLFAKKEVIFTLQDTHRNNIDAIVKTVEAKYFGTERFGRKTLKAAAYFCFIIKDHPVVDGNKRLAVIFLEIYCRHYKLRPTPTDHNTSEPLTLDILAVSVENSPESRNHLETLILQVEEILFKNSD